MVSFIKIEGRTLRGIFQERPNRFLALVKVEDMILPSFLPNPGRMHELLTPGTEVILREVLKENRKTDYDLIGVFYNGQMVSVDSRVPNKLVLEALKNRDIEELLEYNIIKPEYSYGHTRFDFFLANEDERCLLEVKSCTLVKDGVAMFPDVETERGRRHVTDLVKAKRKAIEHVCCLSFKEPMLTCSLPTTKPIQSLEKFFETRPWRELKYTPTILSSWKTRSR